MSPQIRVSMIVILKHHHVNNIQYFWRSSILKQLNYIQIMTDHGFIGCSGTVQSPTSHTAFHACNGEGTICDGHDIFKGVARDNSMCRHNRFRGSGDMPPSENILYRMHSGGI